MREEGQTNVQNRICAYQPQLPTGQLAESWLSNSSFDSLLDISLHSSLCSSPDSSPDGLHGTSARLAGLSTVLGPASLNVLALEALLARCV